MAEDGIKYEPTVHHTPKENGLIEISQFHLHKKAAAILLNTNLPKFLQPLALKHTAYLKEYSPAKRLKGRTPYELWHGKKPDLSYLKIFSSVAYFGTKPVQSKKFASRGLRGRFVGYDSDAIIYLIWIKGTREVRRERNVIVHEDYGPYSGHKDQTQDELDQELGPQPGLQ